MSQEKTERMATGGGVYHPPTTHDPIDEMLDSQVDIELKDAIDSDCLELFQNIDEECIEEREDGNVLLTGMTLIQNVDKFQ